MRIGFVAQNQGPGALDQLKRLAPTLEDLGYHSVALTDHVIGAKGYEPHGYGPYWLECLSGLSWMAAQTKRIRLGTSVLVAPLRDPVYAAKVLSTIDNLSDGRLWLGIGVGWSRGEYHALGRGGLHEQRGAVNDATLELMVRCWEGGAFGWTSEFFQFRHMEFEPTPVQKPHPPIYIGGPPIPPVARRVKRYGMTWHPSTADPQTLREGIEKLEGMIGARPEVIVRSRMEVDFEAGRLRDMLGAFKDIGCLEAMIDLRGSASFEDAAAGAERAMKVYKEL